MKIHQRFQEGTIILSPQGTLFTEENVESMKQIIFSHLRSGNKRVILDLRGLHHLNSVGISILLHARKVMQRADGELTLASANEVVRDVLHRTGLMKHFAESPTVQQALLELSRQTILPQKPPASQIAPGR